MRAKVTVKGQITLPKKLRLRLGIKRGDRVAFHESEKGEVILSKEKISGYSAGILTPHLPQGWKAPTIEEMNTAIEKEVKRQRAGKKGIPNNSGKG